MGNIALKRLLHSLGGSALILTALWFSAFPAHAQFSYVPLLYNGPLPLCRLGINGALRSYPVKPLRIGWFLDYGAGARSVAVGDISYYPMLRLEQTSTGYNYAFSSERVPATETQLRAAISTRPSSYWFIGNEPDRIRFQDDMEPHVYAQAYHDLYHLIKSVDPTAKIVAGAIVQPTPVRLQYLDLVLQSYYQTYKQKMPVDAWAFHNFILNEASCAHYAPFYPNPLDLQQICWGAEIPPGVNATDGLRIDVQANDDFELFKQQVYAFRQWMADRGYRDTPAFLSEFGILMPPNLFEPDFTPERVNNFMNATFDFLMNTTDPNIGHPADNNRLVQRFAWYSVDDNVDHNGFLFDRTLSPEVSLTPMGANFMEYSHAVEDDVDFYPTELSVMGAPPLSSQGTTTVTLQAIIANSGNLAVGKTATVRFYRGDPNNGGDQIGSEQTVRLQGCGDAKTVRLEWGAVTPGNYEVYVEVLTSYNERNESNNLRSTTVTFSNEQILLPQLNRELTIP